MIVKLIGTVNVMEYDIPIKTLYKEIDFIDLGKDQRLLDKRFSRCHQTFGFSLGDKEKFFIFCFGTPNGLWRKEEAIKNLPIGDSVYTGGLLIKGTVPESIVIEPDFIIGERLTSNIVFLFIDVFKRYNDQEFITSLLNAIGFSADVPKPVRRRRRRKNVSPIPLAFTEYIDDFLSYAEKKQKKTTEDLQKQQKMIKLTRQEIAELDNGRGRDLLKEFDEVTKRLNQLQYQLKTSAKRYAELEAGGEVAFIDREILRKQGIRVSISSRKQSECQCGISICRGMIRGKRCGIVDVIPPQGSPNYAECPNCKSPLGSIEKCGGHITETKDGIGKCDRCGATQKMRMGNVKAETDHIFTSRPTKYGRNTCPKGTYLGKFIIRIPIGTLNPQTIRIRNTAKPAGTVQHYHVYGGGKLCWGTMENKVTRFLETGDYTSVIMFLVTMLNTGISGSVLEFDLPEVPPKLKERLEKEKKGEKKK